MESIIHRKEKAAVALLVLMLDEQLMIVLHGPQQQHSPCGTKQCHPCQQGEYIAGIGKHQMTGEDVVDKVGQQVTAEKAQPHPESGGSASVPQQQAEDTVIAQIKNTAGIFRHQSGRQFCSAQQISRHTKHDDAQRGHQSGIGMVALPFQTQKQDGEKDGGEGQTKALCPAGKVQLAGNTDTDADEQATLEGCQMKFLCDGRHKITSRGGSGYLYLIEFSHKWQGACP